MNANMNTVHDDYRGIEQVLEKHDSYASLTRGTSMRPLLRTGMDVVYLERPSEPPKKYDVVLYRMGGKYILHRIIRVNKRNQCFIIRGDNTYRNEHVPFSMISARLVAFNRGGKFKSVNSLSYRIYSHIWRYIFPLRFIIHAPKALFNRMSRGKRE